MARIPSISAETATPEQAQHLQTLAAVRGTPVSNIFLAIANAPALGEGVLAMASSLRRSPLLSRRLRELAIIAVGIETHCHYELAHHWASALKLGLSQAELESVVHFETSELFKTEERAVIRYAREATRNVAVSDATWQALASLDAGARLELVLTVAWYNCVSRIAEPLQLDMEDWFRVPPIPDLAFPR